MTDSKKNMKIYLNNDSSFRNSLNEKHENEDLN
jgi:hypothetical protein